MNTPSVGVAIAILCLSTSLVWAQDGSDEGIGLFTAVQGAVSVNHPRAADTLPVNLHDEVLFKDVIQTRDESRTKAFLEDDSILTVGEKSRVEITEYIYDPDRNLRRTVVKLVQGRLRALVAKVFNGPGSAFEIHTPTAVAAARGTYFVVWVENGATGIVNIGKSGRVDFTSGDKTVTVAPGEYSFAESGEPPAPPLVYHVGTGVGVSHVLTLQKATEGLVAQTGQTIDNTVGTVTAAIRDTLGSVNHSVSQTTSMLASAMNAIEGTVLKDAPKPEMAGDAVRASHLPVLATPAAPGMKATPGPNGTPAGKVMQATQITSVVPSATAIPVIPTAPVVPTVLATPTVTVAPVAPILAPVTPPAIISGAINILGK